MGLLNNGTNNNGENNLSILYLGLRKHSCIIKNVFSIEYGISFLKSTLQFNTEIFCFAQELTSTKDHYLEIKFDNRNQVDDKIVSG